MPNPHPVRRVRQDDQADVELRAAMTEALDVIQRLYDMTGQPDLKPILDRGWLALGVDRR